MEIARELDSVANGITIPVDVKMKGKVKKYKKMDGRVINSPHVILKDMTQFPHWGVAIGKILALLQQT